MTLQQEIEREQNFIQTDSYPISIGELISMYKDGELYIHPEFQRLIRWEPPQKSKFIESILLGIPIPPIFVSQENSGVWDVIDGLQRLATIFGFVGCLRDQDNITILPPLKLTETKYLPSLKNKLWISEAEEDSFTDAQRLYFKRTKINVQIVKRESDPSIKYELFQRINTLGSKLSDQELRNCIFIMKDKELFKWIVKLSKYQPFINCIDLSEKDQIEKYDQEIVTRFFVIKNAELNNIRKAGNFADYISDFITKEYWGIPGFNKEHEERIFKKTFDILNETLKEDSFKKYNSTTDRFEGRFLVSSFEAISGGLSKNIDLWNLTETNREEIRSKIRNISKGLWRNPRFKAKTGVGKKFNERIPAVVEIGTSVFRQT
jgi:uncharacterized protein with ParB-like and HNH nuclease domain